MTDAELRAYGIKRNDFLWEGDVFELFFKPRADGPEYYEFQANPRSVIFETAIPKRGSDFLKLLAQPPIGDQGRRRGRRDARPAGGSSIGAGPSRGGSPGRPSP